MGKGGKDLLLLTVSSGNDKMGKGAVSESVFVWELVRVSWAVIIIGVVSVLEYPRLGRCQLYDISLGRYRQRGRNPA